MTSPFRRTFRGSARGRQGRQGSAILCLLAFATGLVSAAAVQVGRGAYQDRNRDGRVDVWRHFDHHGHIDSVWRDTNFDGRVDSVENYAANRLVRRESDRNFDYRIDLVEEFDGARQTRTMADVDSDGVADALILSRDARAPVVRWVGIRDSAPAPARTPAALAGFVPAPLADPFSQTPSFRPEVSREADLTFTSDAAPDVIVNAVRYGHPQACGTATLTPDVPSTSTTFQSNTDRAPPTAAL